MYCSTYFNSSLSLLFIANTEKGKKESSRKNIVTFLYVLDETQRPLHQTKISTM